MKKQQTLILVMYNDKYGSGDDITNEVVVKSEADFRKWLKERNKARVSDGERHEGEDEFTLHYINLVQY
jgi:hypothetical protein